MATYHLSVKFGGKGQAANHADYIERKEKYRDRQDLEYSAHGNMPEWARDNPSHFWQAADQFERANGSTYRELEIALPRELTPEQRLELVQDFVRQEAGERHAWSFAIHNPKASIDGGEQPHAHIMMSQRVNDGIERTPEQYFRRYNARYPERGGAKKDSGSLTLTQQKEQLRELRKRWEVKHNEHMRKHGFERGFIDCRTLKEQERKLLHVLATAEKNDLQAQESERKQAVQKRIEGKKQRRERNHRLFLAAGLLIEAGLVDTKTGELCYKKDRILQALKELKYDLETSPNPDA
ncbi:MobA/MobL family protein [Escherichia coli]|uniref:MobA/MobL family protein n=3 Tax=Escherichia coli TaxID=562 RepID=UPI00098C14EE